MSFSEYSSLAAFMVSLGVRKAFYKHLTDNDNSKQQIYLGGDFKTLTEIPFGEILKYTDAKKPNFKAPVEFWWINDNQEYSPAPHTQLILYPKYPEVRLSGFMSACSTAPKGYMNPVPIDERGEKNSKDGRVLIFGVTDEGRVYGYLAVKDSLVSRSIFSANFSSDFAGGTLRHFPLDTEGKNSKLVLLSKLSEIHQMGWIESCRLDKTGQKIPYNARNGGGYTLEALFGITPNGRSEPDFKGWELKAFKGSRLTLMTPEPDAGFYYTEGAKEFTLKYGHDSPPALKYFTGTHVHGVINKPSGMLMEIHGFNQEKGKIEDVSGGIYLIAPDGSEAAIWSFSVLLKHWSRKHAHACYVKYLIELRSGVQGFSYTSPVFLGEGTDFALFLKAMGSGTIVYDPATKVIELKSGNTGVKARSQFRMNFSKLGSLYTSFSNQEI